MRKYSDGSPLWSNDLVDVLGQKQRVLSGKHLKFNTGWGRHSSPGKQGFGTVQINMMIRLCFGKAMKPQGCYDLDARELTEVGRFLIQAAVGHTAGVSQTSFFAEFSF